MRQHTKENMCKTRTSNEKATMRKSLGQKMILFLVMLILLVQIKGKYYRSKNSCILLSLEYFNFKLHQNKLKVASNLIYKVTTKHCQQKIFVFLMFFNVN